MIESKVAAKAKAQSLGVFCVEGWSARLDTRSTVRPLLELLESEAGIRTIYQRVASMEELRTYLGYWSNYSTYELGFFALHGDPGEVAIGSDSSKMSELIDITTDPNDPVDLDLTGKTVYFGSYSTLKNRSAVRRFREACGARLVCGYTKDVDWLESAAFEMLLLSRFAANADPVSALKPLYRHHRGLIRRLGFASVPKVPS